MGVADILLGRVNAHVPYSSQSDLGYQRCSNRHGKTFARDIFRLLDG